MAVPGRKSRRRRTDRRESSKIAVEFLSGAFESGLNSNSDISDNAARQILSVGKKHGARPESRISRMICRTCRKSMVPGTTSRVRISSKTIRTTCLRCGRISRFGPNFGVVEK